MFDQARGERILTRHRKLVEAALRRALARHRAAGLSRVIRYHLGYVGLNGRARARRGGKGVRSALCLLTCQALGGQPEWAAPAGAAIELLHSFTLLHDDIVDRDEFRRGQPSAWRVWGVGQAITAGDAMFALANLAMSGLEPAQVCAEVVAATLRELNQATLEVCEGQRLDISYEGRMDISVDDYLRMIALKTAALFRAGAGIGGLIAGARQEQVTLLRRFAADLGSAYQIRDDILGMWGDPRRLGKPVGSDLRQNKRSLPILLALGSDDSHLRSHVADALARGVAGEEEAAALAAEIEADGVRGFCEQLAGQYLRRSLTRLRKADLQEEPAADLRTLAIFLAKRDQ